MLTQLAACSLDLYEIPKDIRYSDEDAPGADFGGSGDAAAAQPCEFNSDCPLNSFCNEGLCAEGCVRDSDCATGLTCTDGVCHGEPGDGGELDSGGGDGSAGNDGGKDGGADGGLPDGGADAAPPIACQSSVECPMMSYCAAGLCASDCSTPKDCGPNQACDGNGRCIDVTRPDGGPADNEPPDTGPEDTGTPDAGPEDTGSDDTGSPDTAPPAKLDLVGWWAEEIAIHADIDATWISAKDAVTYDYLIVRIDYQDGVYLETTTRYCEIIFPVVSGVETIISQQVIDSIGVIHAAGTMLSTGEEGADYSPPSSAEVMGAELTDRFNDALPARATGFFGNECPPDTQVASVAFRGRSTNICYADRLRDSDQDTVPGITVRMKNLPWPINGDVDAFIVLRNIVSLKGTVFGQTDIHGGSYPNLTQHTLSIDNFFQDVGSISPVITTLPDKSQFQMVRIDGQYNSPNLDTSGDGQITCDELIAQKDLLGFGQP